jgi:hypothetical protein
MTYVALPPNPSIDVFLRHLKEAENIFQIALCYLRRLTGPSIRFRHAFFSDLDEHTASGNLLLSNGRWW